MTGEGVCGLVVGPLGGEVVRHDACSKTLQPRIFNFVKSVGVQDRDQGLWSVITVKWLMPARKMLHFAQATARHSCSMTAYLLYL